MLSNSSWKSWVRTFDRNSSANKHTISGEGWRGGAEGAGVEIPLQPLVQMVVMQMWPCSPWRSLVEPRSTCSLCRTLCQSWWICEGGCDPVGSSLWSSLLAGPVYEGERNPWWSRFVGRTCNPVGDLHWSEELQPTGRIHSGEFVNWSKIRGRRSSRSNLWKYVLQKNALFSCWFWLIFCWLVSLM